MSGASPILAVVGMGAEARLLQRHGIETVIGGGDAERLVRALDAKLSRSASEASFEGVLSFGVAGGLSPELNAGDLVIATEVVQAGRRWPDRQPADADWAARLVVALPNARLGPIVGVPGPVASAPDKAALFAATGALAADMESHLAAQAAARHRLPFAAIRAVSDPAHRTLPRAAVAGFGADGGVDLAAVLGALARDLRQIPALIRTAQEAGRAFTALAFAVRASTDADPSFPPA